MLFILIRKYLYIRSFQKKTTGTIILYRILNITYYRIYVNYRILTVTGLQNLRQSGRKKTCNFPAIIREKTQSTCSSCILFISNKWQWQVCSQVRLVRLLRSESGTNDTKWDCHNFSQLRLAKLFPSETGTIVPKWHLHNYSQVTIIRLFPSGTGANVPKLT